jgi:FKBP-type peptidyl-prolyl cis-trans isomerase
MTKFRPIALFLVVVSLAGGLAACGGGGDGFRNDGSKIDGDPSTPLPAELASTKSSVAQREPGQPLPEATSIGSVSTDLAKKPAVPKPSGPAPKELQGKDVVVGNGPQVKDGDKVSVQYVGVLYSDGKQFDASWDRGKKPFEFTVGQSQVIQGWDQGLPGMKVGGRRVLVIPSDLAYGAAGSPPKIPANSPLVFVVDLKKIA